MAMTGLSPTKLNQSDSDLSPPTKRHSASSKPAPASHENVHVEGQAGPSPGAESRPIDGENDPIGKDAVPTWSTDISMRLQAIDIGKDNASGSEENATAPNGNTAAQATSPKGESQPAKNSLTHRALAKSGGREIIPNVLYVGGLDQSISEATLENLFSTNGTVISVKIVQDKNGASKNYAFVQFASNEAALAALQTYNGHVLHGSRLLLNYAYQSSTFTTSSHSQSETFNLFVGDLPPEIGDERLFKLFSHIDALSSAYVMWDMESGRSRGYGFVTFTDLGAATRALHSMQGHVVLNRSIRCNWAQHKSSAGTQANQKPSAEEPARRVPPVYSEAGADIGSGDIHKKSDETENPKEESEKAGYPAKPAYGKFPRGSQKSVFRPQNSPNFYPSGSQKYSHSLPHSHPHQQSSQEYNQQPYQNSPEDGQQVYPRNKHQPAQRHLKQHGFVNQRRNQQSGSHQSNYPPSYSNHQPDMPPNNSHSPPSREPYQSSHQLYSPADQQPKYHSGIQPNLSTGPRMRSNPPSFSPSKPLLLKKSRATAHSPPKSMNSEPEDEQAYASKKVMYVGNMKEDFDSDYILALCRRYGHIRAFAPYTERGYAFVTYHQHDSAAMAIMQMSGLVVDERPLKCGWGKLRLFEYKGPKPLREPDCYILDW